MSGYKCKVKLSYPKPKVECQNIEYGNILLQDYAGAVSELTAINLYVYQHIISEKRFKDYSELIMAISIVEMKHLELLGETIKLLGVKPVFTSSFAPNGQLWTADYVNFSDYLLEMLIADMESEKKAIENYEDHACLIKDEHVRKLLYRIILDEKLHLKLFHEMYEKYKRKFDEEY